MKLRQATWGVMLAAVIAAATGCGRDESAGSGAGNTAASTNRSGNPLTAPVDYLGAVGAAKKTAANVTDLATLRQAIQAFHAGEDRLPRTLQELVSEGYLPRLPQVPEGMRIAYQPESGQVQIVPAGAR